MSKLNTHSPKYCMKDNWENWFNLLETFDGMYLTGILEVQYFHVHIHNDDKEVK